MTFGERLTELRISNGYNKRNEFAEKLGIPSTTLRNYETDAREPGHTFLKQISELFNVSIDYLLCLTDEKERITSYSLKASEVNHIKKYRALDGHGKDMVDMVLDKEHERASQSKIIDFHAATKEPSYCLPYHQRIAAAGKGMIMFDDIPTDLIEVSDTPMSRRADFIIGVNGESMEPTFHDGDKVYVEKTNEIPTGSIGIFINGSECYIKELGIDRLVSHNKEYDDILANPEIRCVGLVLGKVEE